ncbi:MAG TPA: response regulator transcription factor [Urbifossiella sp.]|jgi:DNA-binding NarL/FixJ family response regulator|nr:response regulator transcription factor [Urbifossiella sp.]
MSRSQPTPAAPPTGVLIVDDHPVTREGLAIRLAREPDLRVCGEAADIPEALLRAAETTPDVAVVDVSLKGGCGIDLVKRLRGRHPGLKILVWSMYPDGLYARRAVQAGAAGYVNKEHAADVIVSAIRHVLAGGVFLSPEVTQALLREAGGLGGPLPDPVAALSDREIEVFRRIGEGLDTHQIAGRMHLSPKTVETYRARVRAKLGADSGAEVVRQAIRWVFENG